MVHKWWGKSLGVSSVFRVLCYSCCCCCCSKVVVERRVSFTYIHLLLTTITQGNGSDRVMYTLHCTSRVIAVVFHFPNFYFVDLIVSQCLKSAGTFSVALKLSDILCIIFADTNSSHTHAKTHNTTQQQCRAQRTRRIFIILTKSNIISQCNVSYSL